MRTRSSLEYTIPRRRNRRRSRQQQEAIPIVDKYPIQMADDRPMAEQLQAPTGGFESAIVVPPINAQNFELKSSLINLVQNRIFRGVSKFINFFFPPSKTTNLRNEITNFRQIAQESFSEAWERFKELLRKCPHHGFSLMHQLDTFYNSLSYNDQDSLNSAAGGNFLYKSPTEGLFAQEIRTILMMMLSAKRQKTSEYEAYVSGESSSGQVFQEEQAPSTSGNQEQDDDFDFWTDSYASDDDEIPTKQVSQKIIEEVSLTIDEAKLRKMADEMLRQRFTSGDEHQYHIDQMKNFLKSDIVWESRKEILVSPHPRKTTPLVHSCQKDPEAPALSLINQDLLYLKKGNSLDAEKIVWSTLQGSSNYLNDDENEERTSRWVHKSKEPGKPKEEIYSNLKIIQVIKMYWELGHEHKFITKINARRANDCIVSIIEPDYKNLNKNDIEDIYLLIMNGKIPDYADTRLLWSLSVFIRSSVIWERDWKKHDMFFHIYEHVHGIIYKNSKKEKRVMRHTEIHKFCDATLNRVLEGLKSYNNDIKYGYVQKDLTKDETEYLKLFEEEIEASKADEKMGDVRE
ncbi:retrovirus-related pol polyprotein from transposon TNT 1-94 [Tanacetum coccineum]